MKKEYAVAIFDHHTGSLAIKMVYAETPAKAIVSAVKKEGYDLGEEFEERALKLNLTDCVKEFEDVAISVNAIVVN